MKLSLDRIISIATLAALLVAIFLLLKKPAPVTQLPQAPAGNSANESSKQTMGKAEAAAAQPQPTQPSQAGGYSAAPQSAHNAQASQSQKPVPNVNSSEISAAIGQILGSTATGTAGLSPDSDVGAGMPNIKDQKVTYDGDTVHGQFLTEIGGKDVWITISGHMGQKDGYATFDPTEFKVGDIEVPVALVNPALQKKLADERDRLKIAEPAK
ncbi:MAG: hypothetical protein ABSA78_00710 [Candidatus Sulfotelmatobacter sp.]|jgi:hypothetical protein